MVRLRFKVPLITGLPFISLFLVLNLFAYAHEKILLIEDEPGLIATLSKRLKAEGYDVSVSTNGRDGLNEAVSGLYDLVILDVMLPGMDGFDVCRDLRRHNEHIPILMLTARGQTIDKVLGFKLGADDYQTNPFKWLSLSCGLRPCSVVLLQQTIVQM